MLIYAHNLAWIFTIKVLYVITCYQKYPLTHRILCFPCTTLYPLLALFQREDTLSRQIMSCQN
jgi:hypothetical protein